MTSVLLSEVAIFGFHDVGKLTLKGLIRCQNCGTLSTAALKTLVWSHDGGALGEVLPVTPPPVHADSVLLLQGESVLQRPLGVVLNIDIVQYSTVHSAWS